MGDANIGVIMRFEVAMKDHRLYELPTPLVFAHRGGKKYAPENALASFSKALAMGAQAIELDVTLSKDEEIVVIHDNTLDRTTNGSGRVDAMTLLELKELDAGSHFSSEYSDQRIPILAEVFELVGEKAIINIEIKDAGKRNALLVERTVALVRSQQMQRQVIFSSFIPENVRGVRSELPDCPVGLLTLPGLPGRVEYFLMSNLSPQLIHPHHSTLSERFIKRQHARGRRVHTYTVNEAPLMRRLAAWGVDGFFCDDIPLAQKTLAEIREAGKSLL